MQYIQCDCGIPSYDVWYMAPLLWHRIIMHGISSSLWSFHNTAHITFCPFWLFYHIYFGMAMHLYAVFGLMYIALTLSAILMILPYMALICRIVASAVLMILPYCGSEHFA